MSAEGDSGHWMTEDKDASDTEIVEFADDVTADSPEGDKLAKSLRKLGLDVEFEVYRDG